MLVRKLVWWSLPIVTLYNIKRHIAYHVFYSTLENENSDGMIERLRVIIEAEGNTNTTSPSQEDDISIQDEIKEYCARIPKKTDYGYQYKLFWDDLFILSDIIKL